MVVLDHVLEIEVAMLQTNVRGTFLAKHWHLELEAQ